MLTLRCRLLFNKKFGHGFLLNLIPGTVHGLGFAAVFYDLQLPEEMLLSALFNFNLGIELGQIFVITAVAPLLGGIKKINPIWHKYLLNGLMAVIFAFSFYWLLERAIV